MKEATGELNMTVITLVAIAAIAALFYLFVWPIIQQSIAQQTCNVYGTYYTARKIEDAGVVNKANKWECCPDQAKGAPAGETTCIQGS